MPKRSSKDANELAKVLVDDIILETERESVIIEKPKNPAAVMLGRLGGLKGGKARVERLSKEQRSEIARKAARTRWGNNTSNPKGKGGDKHD